MSGVHKYPTISFRISSREREEIEAKILASGMSKRDYFVRSCIYNRVCVVGKKELIYQLVEELKIMQTNIREVTDQLEQAEITLSEEGLQDMKNDCLDMQLSGCWMAQVTCGRIKKKALTAATVRAVITGKILLSTITMRV